MRVFVTGASGWLGSALVPELIGAGHEVTGLARSDASAAALTQAGARVHRGDLDDPGGLRGAAGAADGVIHLAFNAGMVRSGDFQGAAGADRRAVGALGEALTGSDRPLVIASATVVLAPGRVGTEQDAPGLDPAAAGGPRALHAASEEVALSFASRGVRSSAVRLGMTCHGDGDHGFLAALVGIARATGVSGFLSDGSSRWTAVHRLDAAHLFRLALEKAPAGSRLHAVADEGVCRSGHRRGDRAAPRRPGGLRPGRRGERALRLPGRLPRGRQPGLEHADPRAAGLAAGTSRAHRGSR
jgi:nucleoside-diphosphate-sugar epimerase